ncbi:MAG: hypothetical protein PHX21_14100 [bacterium]|jgi:plasmid maintenance system antidote protein VapI|nr:hypothetical protein [bacterium]
MYQDFNKRKQAYGITYRGLAKQLEVSEPTVRTWLQKGSISLGDALKIRDVYFPGVPIETLFNWEANNDIAGD